MKTIRTVRRVGTPLECQQLCNQDSDCEFYTWQKSTKINKRKCFLKKVKMTQQKGVVSGEKTCTTDDI